MKKFLNFSTILFSYLLITVLVISCGGSSGGGGGTGDGNPPQVELSEECFLENRQGEATLAAVLCYKGEVIAEIAKNTTELQQLTLLIDSVANAGVTPSRTWDLNTARQIHISYDKDYTLTVDVNTSGDIGTIAETTDHTAEFPLQNLTIASLLNDNKDALRSGGISFMPTSGSSIRVDIAPKLSVETQDDFISMGRFTAPPLGQLDKPLPYVLENDLDLIAPGGEAAEFADLIIPVVDALFEFDGGGHKITLKSAINTVANNKPASIIGTPTTGISLQNFTLDINKPISGTYAVGTILGNTLTTVWPKLQNIKININSDLTVDRSSTTLQSAYLGGVAASGCMNINNVVVKTSENTVLRAFVRNYDKPDSFVYVGGLAGRVNCSGESSEGINNNVVDVTLELSSDTPDPALPNPRETILIGGLVGNISNVSEINSNLIKLAISRVNLSVDLNIDYAAGLSADVFKLGEITNNLVYADFSNLGKVSVAGGWIAFLSDTATGNNIANNMIFIADSFTGSDVQEIFGVAMGFLDNLGALPMFTDNFFSSPVTAEQYDNMKIASFVHTAYRDINFKNLILDNKTNTTMFKGGDQVATLQGKVGKTNGAPLFTLAEAKTDDLTTIFSAGNTSWEAGSGGYPQLKAPADFSAAKKADWDRINGLIQTGLTDRANK